MTRNLESIRYDKSSHTLYILNQLLLPHVTEYEAIDSTQDGYQAIKSMKVRGAPAIALVAIFSLSSHLFKQQEFYQKQSPDQLVELIEEMLDYLLESRPTAVNLRDAIDKLKNQLQTIRDMTSDEIIYFVEQFAMDLFEKDLRDCRKIGQLGADYLINLNPGKQLSILTHCNTGSLATAGFGTALGVIRELNHRNVLKSVYCTETRPYNQGSRLTAYELLEDNISNPTLICDSMVSALLQKLHQENRQLDAIVVGADRISRNGDTANKIGTFQLALIARHFGVKFIVAAPISTINYSIESGLDIPIEERCKKEMTSVYGKDDHERLQHVSIAPDRINVWNPAFDVTPADFIDAIITEQKVYLRKDGRFDLQQ